LVVDDNATNRRVFTLLLQSWGCEFEQAEDGAQALDTLRAAHAAHRPFDFALLDMHMPKMDGEELGRRIKADPALAGLPLVMLTSLGERATSERLKQIGFAGCLTKPVKQAQLYQCLALVLGQPDAASEAKPARFIAGTALPQGRLRKARILLAEDNITNQKVALGILEKLGYRADAVANGREVLRSLETIPYTLVLMDCQMPEMDGYEATREIRNPASKVLAHDVPVVAMTAYAMQGDREKCLAAGMNDYVTKPVQPRELADALERWLGPGEPAAPSETPSASPPSAPPPDSAAQTFNESDLLERLMGDEDLARTISRSFVQEATRQIAGLQDSLARADLTSATRHAHSLKGSSANLGAQALRETAARIEELLKSGEVAAATGLLPQLSERFETLMLAMSRFLTETPPNNPT
jgi:CheY-like chemotaxis protein/HPt (histidine-containing phosphotransfer) domain-containing protein